MSNIIDISKGKKKNKKEETNKKLTAGIEKLKVDTLNYYKKICNEKEFLDIVEKYMDELVFCDLFNNNSDTKKMMVQFASDEDAKEFHKFIINVSKEILIRTENIIRLELELYRARKKK